jgi:hypothetical protein
MSVGYPVVDDHSGHVCLFACRTRRFLFFIVNPGSEMALQHRTHSDSRQLANILDVI